MEDAAARELLERARRLYLAARQFELLELLPEFGRNVVEREKIDGGDVVR